VQDTAGIEQETQDAADSGIQVFCRGDKLPTARRSVRRSVSLKVAYTGVGGSGLASFSDGTQTLRPPSELSVAYHSLHHSSPATDNKININNINDNNNSNSGTTTTTTTTSISSTGVSALSYLAQSLSTPKHSLWWSF